VQQGHDQASIDRVLTVAEDDSFGDFHEELLDDELDEDEIEVADEVDELNEVETEEIDKEEEAGVIELDVETEEVDVNKEVEDEEDVKDVEEKLELVVAEDFPLDKVVA
jgi:hypothetical protein